LKGNLPERRTWSTTPAPQTSQAFPYCLRVRTSGDMYCAHPTRPFWENYEKRKRRLQ
jgi:hypothetical protein